MRVKLFYLSSNLTKITRADFGYFTNILCMTKRLIDFSPETEFTKLAFTLKGPTRTKTTYIKYLLFHTLKIGKAWDYLN